MSDGADNKGYSPLAHRAVGADGVREHGLEDHLRGVAALASNNAASFGGENWARLAGLWHDLGKYRLPFQRYLRAASDADAQDAQMATVAAEAPGTPVNRLRALLPKEARHLSDCLDRNSNSAPDAIRYLTESA